MIDYIPARKVLLNEVSLHVRRGYATIDAKIKVVKSYGFVTWEELLEYKAKNCPIMPKWKVDRETKGNR